MNDSMFGRSPAMRQIKGGTAEKFGLAGKPPRKPLSLDGIDDIGMPATPSTPPAKLTPEPAPAPAAKPAKKATTGERPTEKKPAKLTAQPKSAPTGELWAYASVQPDTYRAVRDLARARNVRLSDLVIQAVDAYEPTQPEPDPVTGALPLSGPATTGPVARDQFRVQPVQHKWLEKRVAASGLNMSKLVGAALDAYVAAHADEIA